MPPRKQTKAQVALGTGEPKVSQSLYSVICVKIPDCTMQKGKYIKDTLLLDTSTGKANASVDEKVKLNEKMMTSIKEAIVGYGRFDFVENFNQVHWRQWNERQINTSKAMLMRNSFLLNGMDRFNPTHAIPLVIKKNEVVEGTYVKDPTHVREELPIVRFTGATVAEGGLRAAGGQHRIKAMKMWIEVHQTRKKELEHEISSIKNMDKDDVDADVQAHNERLKPLLQSVLNLLACSGEWAVVLFNEGKQSLVQPFCATSPHLQLRGCGRLVPLY
jgi:hypothetical protein